MWALKSSLPQDQSFWSSSVQSSAVRIKALYILIKSQQTTGYFKILCFLSRPSWLRPRGTWGEYLTCRLHSAANGSCPGFVYILADKNFWHRCFSLSFEQDSVRLFPRWPADGGYINNSPHFAEVEVQLSLLQYFAGVFPLQRAHSLARSWSHDI